MRVLVTGAKGLVGRPLVTRLARSCDVVGLDVEELDVRDPAACERDVTAVRPDAVCHLAAWTDVDGAEKDPDGAAAVNSAGAQNVARACRSVGAAMLYVSTDYVFDGTKAAPYVEEDAVNPLSVYGRTKLEGERRVRETAPRWWIVRCQSIYGAGRKSFVDAILARAAAGGPLTVVADQRVTPSWCEDVAEALAAVVTSAPPGVYHAANGGSCTWYDCAKEVLALSGLSRVEMHPTTAAELARPAKRPANSVFDCTRLERATGLRLRVWRDALAAYLATRPAQGAAA
jgi:dTDP-4-dehydrorhamnose reductase